MFFGCRESGEKNGLNKMKIEIFFNNFEKKLTFRELFVVAYNPFADVTRVMLHPVYAFMYICQSVTP